MYLKPHGRSENFIKARFIIRNITVFLFLCCINGFTSLCKNLFKLLEFLAEAFDAMCNGPPGASSIENDAHGIEKLLLKTQVSLTNSCIVK